jgi:hypothetical protein
MARETSKFKISLLLLMAIFFAACTNRNNQVDLIRNDAQMEQAFQQILTNTELFEEFMNELGGNPEAINRMIRNRDFASSMFSRENMNYLWEHHPGMDTAVIDNVTTRMLTDTAFHNQFNRRMGQGTPASR